MPNDPQAPRGPVRESVAGLVISKQMLRDRDGHAEWLIVVSVPADSFNGFDMRQPVTLIIGRRMRA